MYCRITNDKLLNCEEVRDEIEKKFDLERKLLRYDYIYSNHHAFDCHLFYTVFRKMKHTYDSDILELHNWLIVNRTK